MNHKVIMQIEAALACNQQLLAQADQDDWDGFGESLALYTPLLAELCAYDFKALEGTHRSLVAVRLAHLLTEDGVLKQHIQQRLFSLHSDIAFIQKSRHSVRAYHAVP